MYIFTFIFWIILCSKYNDLKSDPPRSRMECKLFLWAVILGHTGRAWGREVWWLISCVNLPGPWCPSIWFKLFWMFLPVCFWRRLIFEGVDFEQSRWSSVMLVGLTQSVEDLSSTRDRPPKSKSKREFCQQTVLGLQRQSWLFPGLQAFWHALEDLDFVIFISKWTNSLKCLCFSNSPILFPLWKVLTTQLGFGPLSQAVWDREAKEADIGFALCRWELREITNTDWVIPPQGGEAWVLIHQLPCIRGRGLWQGSISWVCICRILWYLPLVPVPRWYWQSWKVAYRYFHTRPANSMFKEYFALWSGRTLSLKQGTPQ